MTCGCKLLKSLAHNSKEFVERKGFNVNYLPYRHKDWTPAYDAA